MKKVSYSQFQKKHGGQFIARRGSKVLAYGKSLGMVRRELKEKKIPYTNEITIGYIDPRGAVCVYSLSLPL